MKKSTIILLLLLATPVLALYSFRGPLRNVKAGSWIAHRLAWINDTNDVNSVEDLTDWIAGTSDEITITDDGDGTVTLSLDPNAISAAETDPCAMPYLDQSVKIAASPTFAALTVDGNVSFAGSASFNLPTAAAPTLDAAGELAHDTTVTGLANGCLSYYDGAAIQYVVDLTTLPSNDDYVIAYDADADGFYMKVDANSAAGMSWATAPNKPTDSGTAGDMAYDSGNLYVCIATDTWKRTALSTWTNNILLETGDAALLETADNLLKE